jgi:hypothetical protein
VTEFAAETRHYCRNPKCHSKLPKPVSNERDAFCARGCHSAFYRKRCLVCEEPMERKTENQKLCGKRRCRNAFKGSSGFGRYHSARSAIHPLKTSIKPGVKSALRADRGVGWAIAVNRSRIYAPRRVIDAFFGHVRGRA